ncbi:T cell receptor alpha chain MC.7.G5-like [Chaetodon trifascialis]|uniref:T cell receptor alpha chain MC.7.G5-like n=1 Tax=Chaetodon trifascialis TaxID=109706 RepID=UPI0039916556
MFKLYVLLVSLFRAYGALLYANTGDNVTLPCFYASDSAKYLCWYKQVAGEQPQIISSFYRHSPDTNKFHNQFKGDRRFSVHPGRGFYHLNISDVHNSDSAMYYCGQISITVTDFDNGMFLVVKGSSRESSLQQPASQSVKPGGSVTLNCTVHNGTSDGEHSVYWFKEESRNSQLGIMYIKKNNSNQCVKSSEFPVQSCVYSLSMRNVSLSDAGTYYCAVASCGEILFGKGTRLHVGGLHPKLSVPEYAAERQNEGSDALQYVALDFKKRQSKSRRQRSTEEETIYSGVRLSDLK